MEQGKRLHGEQESDAGTALQDPPEGWRRYPVVIGKNGKLRPNYVVVGGEQRCYEQGRYQIRTYEGSRMVYRDAGDQADAMAELEQAEKLLKVEAAAEDAGVKINAASKRVKLQTALDKYRGASVRRPNHRTHRQAEWGESQSG